MNASTYARVAELPFELESCSFASQEQPILENYRRITTTMRLSGKGCEGLGEDVTYDEPDQLAFQESPVFPPPGSYTIDSFSSALEGLNLFPKEPTQKAYLDYRRWAFESAAMDLALAQNGVDLTEVLKRESSPLVFVMSKHLADPPKVSAVEEILSKYPRLRLKLDPTSAWDDAFVSALSKLDVVDCVDLKGQYKGTPVDQPADPAMYRRVAEAFTSAWIEDPEWNEVTAEILSAHRDRVTWDAPIHSVSDVEALPFVPKALNLKPSRFGSWKKLLDTYDYCREKGIVMYGGGQSELSIGRDQIQILASIFHPETGNDTAPRAFNRVPLEDGLPQSPLELRVERNRFIIQ